MKNIYPKAVFCVFVTWSDSPLFFFFVDIVTETKKSFLIIFKRVKDKVHLISDAVALSLRAH